MRRRSCCIPPGLWLFLLVSLTVASAAGSGVHMNILHRPGVHDRSDGHGKEFLWTQASKVGDRGLEEAYWIWHARDMLADPEKKRNMRFTRVVSLDAAVDRAWVRMSAQGHYTLSINGDAVGSDDEVYTLDWYDVTSALRAGENTFDIRVTPDSYFCGLFLAGRIVFSDGRALDLRTDRSWGIQRMDEAWQPLDRVPKPAAELVAGVDGGFWNNCGRLFEFPPEYYRLNTELVTPGIDWARPLAGGPVTVAAVHPLRRQRDTVELVHRSGFDVTLFPSGCSRHTHTLVRAPFFPRTKGLFVDEAAANLRDAAAGGKDVILLLEIAGKRDVPEGVDLFRDAFADGLRAHLENGGGLVTLDGALPDDFEADFVEQPTTNLPAFLFTAAPYGRLPIFAGTTLHDGLDFRRHATFYTAGAGRVVRMSRGGLVNHRGDANDLHYQYAMSFVIKAVLWAAGREPATWIASRPHAVKAVSGLPTTFQLLLHAVPAGSSLAFHVRSPRPDGFEDTPPSVHTGIERGSDILRPVVSWQQVISERGTENIDVTIPPLAAGSYFLDFQLVDSAGFILDWGACGLDVTSRIDIADITLSKPTIDVSAGKTDTLGVTVQLTAPVEAGTDVRVSVMDNFDRIVRMFSRSPEAGRDRLRVEFSFERFETTLGRVRVDLLDDGRRVAWKTASFSAVRRNWDRYLFTGWGAWNESYQGNVYWRVLAGLGVDAPRCRGISMEWLNAADTVACPAYPAFPRYGREERDHTELLEAYRERAAGTAREQARFDPMAFNTGDEFTYRRNEEQPSRVRFYRRFLRDKYGNVGRFNAAWGTDYTTFEDVFPLLDDRKLTAVGDDAGYGSERRFLEEARKTRNYARYVDQWLDNTRAFNETARVGLNAIKAVLPEARVGCDCPMWPTPQSGHDWYCFLQEFDYFAPYGRGGEIIPLKQARSYFRPEDGQFIGLTYGGYLYMAFNRKEELTDPQWQWWRIWSGLFQGFTSLWWYTFNPGAAEGNLSPGFVPYESLSVASQAIAEYRDGIYDLLKPTRVRRDYGNIAVYDSLPSRIVAGVVGDGFGVGPYGFIMNTHILGRLLEEHLGYDYTFVDARQVVDGGLEGYRCVLMPMTVALSKPEVAALRKFLEGGGMVVADVRPGLFDGSGNWAGDTSAARELFGVSFSRELGRRLVQTPVRGEVRGRTLDAVPEREYPVETSMRSAGARVLAEADGNPVVTVHRVGRGTAVCLNTSFTFYESTVMLDTHYAYKPNRHHGAFVGSMLEAVFDAAGVTRPVEVETKDGRWPTMLNIASLPDGRAHYIGVTKGRVSDHEAASEVTLIPDQGGHVVDVRSGKYLGELESIPLSVSPVDVRLFSILPYRVDAVQIEPADSIVGRGEMLELTLEVQHPGAGVRHVLNVRVMRPDGQRVPVLTRNVELPAGQDSATVHLPIAFNDPVGRWTVRARDVAAGVTGEQTFEVR